MTATRNNLPTADIIIFARYWAPGTVKTRLSPPLTPEQAAAVHLRCLDILLQRLAALSHLAKVIAYEPDDAREAFTARYPAALLLPQQGAELTTRLCNALAARNRCCLMTGSDCPSVPLAYYDEAAAALVDGADVVLGQAEDGGSYILGLGPDHAGWFHDIPWSTDQVAAALRLRAREHHWRLHELPPWYDVDTLPALDRLSTDLAQEGIPFRSAGVSSSHAVKLPFTKLQKGTDYPPPLIGYHQSRK